MSERIYRVIHNNIAGGVNAGVFPKSTITLNQQPTDGDKLVLKGKSIAAPELTFVTDTTTGASHKKLHNGINNVNVLIGDTLSETYNNISTAINTHDSLTQVGKTGTITVTVSGDINSATGIILYTNEKLTGPNDAATKTGVFTVSQTNNDAGATFAGYTTGESYVGIQSSGGDANVTVVIRDIDEDGYNIGPPTNQFTTATIALKAGEIHPIETFGCNKAVNVYR
jgi:hypothetical protein